MEYMTIQKNLTHSPRKLRLVADMVRKLSPEIAIEQLEFTNRAAALPLIKAIKTVWANSGNKGGLIFKKIEVNEGVKMRRFRAAPRGRVRPYKKRFSQIKIVLEEVRVESLESSKDQKTKGGK